MIDEVTPELLAKIIKFLVGNLPGNADQDWHHDFISGYQMGCNALVRLGQATETPWGAVPRIPPILPTPLPRDTRAENVVTIVASHNLGEALATPAMISLLEGLGLVKDRFWAEHAETILWRYGVSEWGIDFTGDHRFVGAVEASIDRMPDDIRSEIDRLVVVTDEYAALLQRRTKAYNREICAEMGHSPVRRPLTLEQLRSSIVSVRCSDLDWLFVRRWRLSGNWLSPTEAERALEIFHDRLATAMRKAVVARLYPSFPCDR
ncbi:hypothetical protein DXT91_12520 [Agrobacterium tumefaciens]|uniref:hypothetical protein n=1 Tax=Agrobacterium tumefaciens TaxID=358 RepID=UPI0012B7479F|nr:hypothetical protein [Agrobacterium tumefaciens]MQB04928.1 hypothetical protein [Agrobacterium tumefaciens]